MITLGVGGLMLLIFILIKMDFPKFEVPIVDNAVEVNLNIPEEIAPVIRGGGGGGGGNPVQATGPKGTAYSPPQPGEKEDVKDIEDNNDKETPPILNRTTRSLRLPRSRRWSVQVQVEAPRMTMTGVAEKEMEVEWGMEMEHMGEAAMGQVAEMELAMDQVPVQRVLEQKFYRLATRVLKTSSTKMRKWPWISWPMKGAGFYQRPFNHVVQLLQTGNL